MEEGISLTVMWTIFAIVLICLYYLDLKKARSDLEAMKKQAESTNREYDRLAEENQKLLVSIIFVTFAITIL